MDRVRSGEPLTIRADDWNAVKSLVRRQYELERQKTPLKVSAQRDWVKIHNATEETLEIFSVVGIDGPMIPFESATEENPRNLETDLYPSFRGVVPEDKHGNLFAILQEPARPDEVVRAILFGVTTCKVEMVSDSHQYAKPKEDETGHLVSCDAGPARILCRDEESEDDAVLASVVLGGSHEAGNSTSLHLGRTTSEFTQNATRLNTLTVRELNIVKRDGVDTIEEGELINVYAVIIKPEQMLPPNLIVIYGNVGGVNMLITGECFDG